jgi:hypothetical protein
LRFDRSHTGYRVLKDRDITCDFVSICPGEGRENLLIYAIVIMVIP